MYVSWLWLVFFFRALIRCVCIVGHELSAILLSGSQTIVLSCEAVTTCAGGCTPAGVVRQPHIRPRHPQAAAIRSEDPEEGG